MAYDPFETFNDGFNFELPTANPQQENNGNATKIFGAQGGTAKTQLKAKEKIQEDRTTPVTFPKHLFIPQGAESIDIRRVYNVPSHATDRTLITRFVAPEGAYTNFISYAVYNDGDNAINYAFFPFVDGNRIFRYHGDPLNNYKIDLGLSPDLGNQALIPCQLAMAPGQVLEWYVYNNSGVDTSMGVRMSGYFDNSGERKSEKFG